MPKRNYWSAQEEEYLRKVYANLGDIEEAAAHLGRPLRSVYMKARYMNLRRRGRVANNRVEWTAKEVKFLKKNFHSMTNPQLAEALGKTLTVTRNKCRELGLLHMQLEYWTQEQVEYLKANYRTKGDVQLAREFQQRWPKKKVWTKKHIDKKRGYLGLTRTIQEQFTIRTGRFSAADYKDLKDGRQKYFPEGKKRLWLQNGKFRWMIKVGKEFMHLHRYLWEKKHGPIPKNKKLHFKDGNTTNCKLSNLELLTRSELARKISNKNHVELSDSYIAGILSWRDPEMKKHILNHPGILDAKRQQIIQNRKLGLHRCKKGSPVLKNVKQLKIKKLWKRQQ